jgi:hypothetical protein
MLGARIVGTGLVFAAFVGLGAASAAAQTPGAPLPLLQFVSHGKTQHRQHPNRVAKVEKAQSASRHAAKRRLARVHKASAEARAERVKAEIAARLPSRARTRTPPVATHMATASQEKTVQPVLTAPASPSPAVTAKATPAVTRVAAATQPQALWPAPDAATTSAIVNAPAPVGNPALGPQPTAGSVATETVIDAVPNEIMGNAHAVETPNFKSATPKLPDPPKVGSSAPQPVTRTAQPSPPVSASSPASARSSGALHVANAAPEPVVHAMVARPSPAQTSPVGSASWIAQVLAALGGAIAAGVVAWFLIRPAPERTYG